VTLYRVIIFSQLSVFLHPLLPLSAKNSVQGRKFKKKRRKREKRKKKLGEGNSGQ